MKKPLVLAPLMEAVLALGAAGPASAHRAAPCDDSSEPGNSDYAQHHIVALAHQGAHGNAGHKPGSHGGFSLCLGAHD